MRTILWTCCVVVLAALSARAATVDDIIEMATKGETEEKQVAAVEKTPGEISIGAPEVLRLRDAKISEKVILAMLRHVPADGKSAASNTSPVEPAAAPIPAERPVGVPPANVPRVAPIVQNGLPNGQLTIDNLDDRAWSYMYEPAIQTIWVAPAGRGSAIQAHSSTTVSMRVGTYKVRFIGAQDEGLPMTVFGGERSAISLSRVPAEGGDTLNASIFEHGERKTSGKLAALNALPPQEVVVDRRVVESPVYYTNPPVYYYGGGYGPYYGGYYYGRPSYGYGYYGGSGFNFGFNFGSSGHGHRR